MCTKNSASIWLADTYGEIKVDFFQDRDKLTLDPGYCFVTLQFSTY